MFREGNELSRKHLRLATTGLESCNKGANAIGAQVVRISLERRIGGVVGSSRPWVTLIGFCCFMAVAMAVGFATLLAGGSLAFRLGTAAEGERAPEQAVPTAQAPPAETAGPRTFRGMVTDSSCMGRHVRYPGKSPAECAKMCARGGSSYALVDGDRRYTLSGSDLALDKIAGQRAAVVGTLEGTIIRVSSAGADRP